MVSFIYSLEKHKYVLRIIYKKQYWFYMNQTKLDLIESIKSQINVYNKYITKFNLHYQQTSITNLLILTETQVYF